MVAKNTLWMGLSTPYILVDILGPLGNQSSVEIRRSQGPPVRSHYNGFDLDAILVLKLSLDVVADVAEAEAGWDP